MAIDRPPAGSSSAQSQNVTSTSAWCRSFLTVLLAVAFGYWFRAVQAGAECGSVEGGGVAGSGAVANLLSWSLTPTPGMAPCGDGLFLAGPTPSPFNIGLYMALLLWCFVGVAIGADVFMVKPSRGASNVHPCTCIRAHPLTCMARASSHVYGMRMACAQVAIEMITSQETTIRRKVNGCARTRVITHGARPDYIRIAC